jgi:hypothetical protein
VSDSLRQDHQRSNFCQRGESHVVINSWRAGGTSLSAGHAGGCQIVTRGKSNIMFFQIFILCLLHPMIVRPSIRQWRPSSLLKLVRYFKVEPKCYVVLWQSNAWLSDNSIINRTHRFFIPSCQTGLPTTMRPKTFGCPENNMSGVTVRGTDIDDCLIVTVAKVRPRYAENIILNFSTAPDSRAGEHLTMNTK